MAPPRVDHKIYSRGPSAQSAWRVYEYTGQWPHELVKGFEPPSWAETFTRELATLMGICHGARNVEIKDVVQQLKSSAAERKAPRNCLTRLDISQAREWLIVEKGVTTTKCKRVRHLKEESDDESGKESESDVERDSDEEPRSEEKEAEDEEESGSDPEPLSEINVHDSDDSTSDSSSDDDEMEIDESTASATTKTRLRNGQLTSKQNKQSFPTPSVTPQDTRKRLFDGLDEHYRRAVRRAAMAKKRQSQPQAKSQPLPTPPASGGSVPPNNKSNDRASSSSAVSEPPASTNELWPKRLRTRVGNVSLHNRHESPLRRESGSTIPDSNSESDENSRDTAPASPTSPASVSSNFEEHPPATAPATAAPPAIEPSTVAPTTTTLAPTPSNKNISLASIDSISTTSRTRRNIQLPSRIAYSQPQSAVAIVEKSRKRPREPTVETREHPMSLESSPESEANSVSVMGTLARNASLRSASSAEAVPAQAASSSSQTGPSSASRMSIASLLQVPVENTSSESPSPATLGRDGEPSNPPQSNSPPTTVSPPAKKQKPADTRVSETSSNVDITQPTGENPDEDLPDWDALIADWDAKAARVVNAHTNIQENRITLSEKSKYVEFLEHMHRTNPPDEDGRKHYEDEKRKLGDLQFVHGIFIRGFEEAKRAAVAMTDPDVTLAEQAKRMGASKRKRQGLTH
ncbi:hypothetical protein NW752_008091 [Fusarium irregulare]|uniref:Uncharacterized protein n=1 Tax=Fusarium irregulare TaxID=2494466 RepID=A0A9W8PW48_9HYPO|nr:hypothetical protein NW752_008091 [Fusarium irregulare]KAJ4019641.1 hypothetical protein NW766_003390 [Fusarium irregulare]